MSGSAEVTAEAWREPSRRCLELLSPLFRAPAALDRDGKHQAGVGGEQLQVEDTHGWKNALRNVRLQPSVISLQTHGGKGERV